MEIYNRLHQMELYRNYYHKVDSLTKDQKNDLANFIHDNYDQLNEIEMKNIAMRCLNINDFKRILLFHELKYHNQTPIEMSLDRFLEKALYYLNRYQCRAGGFFIEDEEWTVHRHRDSAKSTIYVEENEILFENTVHQIFSNDNETEIYLDHIINKLKSIATNIDIELRERKEGKIVHLLIWATDRNIKLNTVGL